MSDRVDICEYMRGSGRLRISGDKLWLLMNNLPKDDRPEYCFFDVYDCIELPEEVILEDISWGGEYSSYTFDDYFIGKILPKTEGEAIILAVWESGYVYKYIVKDGEIFKEELT